MTEVALHQVLVAKIDTLQSQSVRMEENISEVK